LKRRVKLPGYELTDHAAGVIAERDIDITWVVRVLAKPDRTESDRSDPTLTHARGRIAERGTHEALYALGGRYWDLYTRQHGLEANLFLAPGEGDSVPESEKAGSKQDAAGVGEAMRILRGG